MPTKELYLEWLNDDMLKNPSEESLTERFGHVIWNKALKRALNIIEAEIDSDKARESDDYRDGCIDTGSVLYAEISIHLEDRRDE